MNFKWQKLMLYQMVHRIIMAEIKGKYYNKILTPDIIKEYLLKNRKDVKEDINRDMMFLEAADYIKKSKEKDKYKIAYEKYKKKGIGHGYKFFKSSVGNENYLKFLRARIKRLSDGTMSNGEKYMLFMQKLPDYILNELSKKDGILRN